MFQANNQRRYERFDLFQRATLSWGGDECGVFLIDVSLGGGQLLSKRSVPEGETTTLRCMLDEVSYEFHGYCRYSRETEDGLLTIGFKFAPSDDSERVAIANFVSSVFLNPSAAPAGRQTEVAEAWFSKAA